MPITNTDQITNYPNSNPLEKNTLSTARRIQRCLRILAQLLSAAIRKHRQQNPTYPSQADEIIKSRQLTCLFICALFTAQTANGAEPINCPEPSIFTHKKNRKNGDIQLYVDLPGRYCLREGVTRTNLWDSHSFSTKSQAGANLLSIGDSYVKIPASMKKEIFDIDLGGNTIEAEPLNMYGAREDIRTAGINLSNGTIIVPGTRNIGIELGAYAPFFLNGERINVGSQYEGEDIPGSKLDHRSTGYTEGKYQIDHITIKKAWRGIDIGGTKKIIRNSTIDAASHTAIYMLGPGGIIENNTIIIRAEGEAKPFDAPIKLRDAHGAIIRNNRIIVKGGWSYKAPFAINLLDSTNVTIEGNTIESAEALVRSNGESQFTERNNTFK